MEPYVILGIVLFIGCQYKRATTDMEWFPDSIERWCRDIFTPFVEKTDFITI
jgi:hypothetical protein